jgi:hypothetical protein
MVGEGLDAGFLSVSGTSSSDVYVVGADPGDGPWLLHYDGADWNKVETGSSGDLWWVWASQGDSVWLCGDGGRVLHYTPSTGDFTEEIVGGDNLTFFGIWGTADDDVWTVGGDVGVASDAAALYHFDGTAWSEVLMPDAAESQFAMYKIWGSASDDVWVVGANGIVVRWDGSAWTDMESPTTRTLFTINGDGDDVYAVGGFGTGTIVHWDGSSWMDQSPSISGQFNGVFVGAGGPVAVGVSGGIWWEDGGEWVADARGPASFLDFHGAWQDENGDVWAVGGSISSLPLNQGMVAYGGELDIPAISF